MSGNALCSVVPVCGKVGKVVALRVKEPKVIAGSRRGGANVTEPHAAQASNHQPIKHSEPGTGGTAGRAYVVIQQRALPGYAGGQRTKRPSGVLGKRVPALRGALLANAARVARESKEGQP